MVSDRMKFGAAKIGSIFLLLMIVSAVDASRHPQDPASLRQAAPSVPANQSAQTLSPFSSREIDDLALKVAAEIKKRRFARVAVFGAAGPGDKLTRVGPALGDALSDVLARVAQGFEVVDRAALRTKLQQERVAESMLVDGALAEWVSSKMRADGYVFMTIGSFDPPNITLAAHVYIAKEEDMASVADWHVGMELSGPYLDAVREPLNSDREIAVKDKSPDKAEMGLSSEPQCIECRAPDYSDAARKAKHRGTSTLVITVTVEGEIQDIAVVKPAGYGLDGAAVEAIQRWKFKPAVDLGGKPIEHRTRIDVEWQLF